MTNLPALAAGPAQPPAVVASKKQKDLFIILKEDHNFDIIAEILNHIKEIKRAKKIKPNEKHRFLQNYYQTLLSYCMPKQKVIEDNSLDKGRPINFSINIGGTETTDPRAAKPVKGGVSITIPTRKQKNGTYAVSSGIDPDSED